MNNSLKKVKGGFTLIELLVVIAIIAILASLAVPAVMKARVRANITKSASNMKQIVLACKLYASDNNDSYPSTTGANSAREYFQLLVGNYAGGEAIFVVPGYTREVPSATDSTSLSITNGYTYVTGLFDTDNAANVVITEPFAATRATYNAASITGQTATNAVFQASGVNAAKIDGSVTFYSANPTISITPTNGLNFGSNWEQ